MKKLLSLLLCLILTGCTAALSGPATTGQYEALLSDPLSVDQYYTELSENPLSQDVIDAIEHFSLESSKMLLTGEDNDNYSPLSLYVALAMATTGAGGDTAEQLYAALGLPNDPDALADAMAHINAQLNIETETGRITLANSIWNQQDIPFREDYITRMTERFQASLFEVDFLDEGTGQMMSDWIARRTNDLIQAEFGDTSDFASVLINTLYFKESWRNEFNPDQTMPDIFHGVTGDVEKDFLRSKDNQIYIHEAGIEGVILPFELSSIVLLKKPGSSPADILKEANLMAIIDSAETAMVDLSLPKFSFDNNYDLKEMVQRLGATLAFDPNQADFSAMSEVDLFISQVKQNSHIGLDETGVEAAAMTAVIMAPTSAPMPNDEVELRFDEPFLFIIRSPEGLPLFIGTVTN